MIALANEAMGVRCDEMRDQPGVVRAGIGNENGPPGVRRYVLCMGNIARAWHLKPREELRSTCATGITSKCPEGSGALKNWISLARSSRLEPFKKLVTTLKRRRAGGVRGMLHGRRAANFAAMICTSKPNGQRADFLP